MNNIAPSAADAAADVSVAAPPSHTKGPWRVLEADDTDFYGPFTICDEDNSDLANVYSADDSTVSIPRAEALGNALVMAAAPALLEALKAMVDRWEPDCGGQDRVMWENARAAIAQAEGA